jgi:hypothetical protein
MIPFRDFQALASDTLNKHRDDRREVLYSPEELESAQTNDDLRNASQMAA